MLLVLPTFNKANGWFERSFTKVYVPVLRPYFVVPTYSSSLNIYFCPTAVIVVGEGKHLITSVLSFLYVNVNEAAILSYPVDGLLNVSITS